MPSLLLCPDQLIKNSGGFETKVWQGGVKIETILKVKGTDQLDQLVYVGPVV